MLGWKIYFGLIVIFLLGSLLAAIGSGLFLDSADKTVQYGLSDWLGILLLGFIAFGVYSYISKKVIFSKTVWKVLGSVLIILLGWTLLQTLQSTPLNQWASKFILPLPAMYIFYKLGWSKV